MSDPQFLEVPKSGLGLNIGKYVDFAQHQISAALGVPESMIGQESGSNVETARNYSGVLDEKTFIEFLRGAFAGRYSGSTPLMEFMIDQDVPWRLQYDAYGNDRGDTAPWRRREFRPGKRPRTRPYRFGPKRRWPYWTFEEYKRRYPLAMFEAAWERWKAEHPSAIMGKTVAVVDYRAIYPHPKP